MHRNRPSPRLIRRDGPKSSSKAQKLQSPKKVVPLIGDVCPNATTGTNQQEMPQCLTCKHSKRLNLAHAKLLRRRFASLQTTMFMPVVSESRRQRRRSEGGAVVPQGKSSVVIFRNRVIVSVITRLLRTLQPPISRLLSLQPIETAGPVALTQEVRQNPPFLLTISRGTTTT
jgi:predicted trehalose synthase